MGNLLAVVVHAVNIHDTKAGILAAKKAFETYPFHLFSGFVLMPDTAKLLSRMFPVNWGLASIFRRVSSLYGSSCPSGGLLNVLWHGSITPAAFPKIMKYLSVLLRRFVPLPLLALC
jgi:hypothetical protein